MLAESTAFLPQTLNEWLPVGVAVAAIVGALWRLGKVVDKINAVGTRLNGHIEETAIEKGRQEGRTDALERANELRMLDISNIREQHARLSTEVETLVRVQQSSVIDGLKDRTEVLERLSRIEALLENNTSIADAIETVAKAFSGRAIK